MKMAVSKVKMKLLIDPKGRKVLFAETGKDGVDFLFCILSLPISTVIRLLNKKDMVGCIANLYESIENLDQNYLLPNQTKDVILKPNLPVSSNSFALFSLTDAKNCQTNFYRCSSSGNIYSLCPSPSLEDRYSCQKRLEYVADDPCAVCPGCGQSMSTCVTYVAAAAVATDKSEQREGLVKDVVTYMVMDNLVIKPMSTISSITLLNQLNVTEVGELQEKTVTLTMEKALKILKLSLESSTILTSVFLP